MPDTSGVCNAVGSSIPLAGPVLGGACNLATNPAGAVTKAVGAAANSVFGQFAESVGQSAGDLLRTSMTWWVKTDSINIDPAAIVSTQRPLQGVFELIMMAGVLGTAIVMALSRRGQPLAELVMGAVKYVAISSLSLTVLSLALSAGDDIAKQLVQNGSNQFGDSLAKLLGTATLTNPATVLLLGILTFLLALIQWVFGFIRQAGILVLASLIAIAAAGQLSTWGRQWFPRIASALVALVLYKPIAAMIYSVGFKFMGHGKDLSTAVIGVMVIALAVIALPAMMKFFSFVGGSVGAGGGGGALALAGGAVGGAAALSQFGGGGGGSDGGSTATSQATYMETTGPGTGVTDTPPGPGGAGGDPGGGGGGEVPPSGLDGGGGGSGSEATVDGGEGSAGGGGGMKPPTPGGGEAAVGGDAAAGGGAAAAAGPVGAGIAAAGAATSMVQDGAASGAAAMTGGGTQPPAGGASSGEVGGGSPDVGGAVSGAETGGAAGGVGATEAAAPVESGPGASSGEVGGGSPDVGSAVSGAEAAGGGGAAAAGGGGAAAGGAAAAGPVGAGIAAASAGMDAVSGAAESASGAMTGEDNTSEEGSSDEQ
jgi:type IV secretion system protein TrbL